MFKALASTSAPTRSSCSSSRAKAAHFVAPILPFCNYCGNSAHKVSECNILEDILCDYYGKERHHEAICFTKFSKWK